jgi:oligopeptide/dipeptide ABC transporter ATP-binding protein
MTSLDPVIRVGPQIDQAARLHLGLSAGAARARSIELMERLRIPEAATVYHHYPHQLSGGMRQRIVIAMALAGGPDLIIADEPTTALDVTIQAQIIGLLAELVRERGVGLVLITHDMGVVAQICDRVVVLYAGRVAEGNPAEAIFAAPRHPYTRALIRCIPRAGMAPGGLDAIPGAVPSVAQYPPGCRFNPRCDLAQLLCRERQPPLADGPGGGRVACHFSGEGSLG